MIRELLSGFETFFYHLQTKFCVTNDGLREQEENYTRPGGPLREGRKEKER